MESAFFIFLAPLPLFLVGIHSLFFPKHYAWFWNKIEQTPDKSILLFVRLSGVILFTIPFTAYVRINYSDFALFWADISTISVVVIIILLILWFPLSYVAASNYKRRFEFFAVSEIRRLLGFFLIIVSVYFWYVAWKGLF